MVQGKAVPTYTSYLTAKMSTQLGAFIHMATDPSFIIYLTYMYADTTFTLQAFSCTLQPRILLRHKSFNYIQLNHKYDGYSQLQPTLTLHLLTIIGYRHRHYLVCLTVMYERLSLAISFYFRLFIAQ